MKKSFYALEMFVAPGGVREALVFVLADLDAVKQVMAASLRRPFDACLLACYGRDVWLSVYHRGERRQEINLLPFINLVIEDSAPFSFDESGEPLAGAGPLPDFDAVIDSLWDDSAAVSGWVDWDRLALEPLSGPVVLPGDVVPMYSHYMQGEQDAAYGVTEIESGYHAAEIDAEADNWGVR